MHSAQWRALSHSHGTTHAFEGRFGTQIVTTGGDGLVKVWKVASSECVSTIEAHGDRAWALAVRKVAKHVMETGAS